MSILVSACLAGELCRYDGKNKLREEIYQLVRQGKAIPLCPEELGGLLTPRSAAENTGQKFLTIDGENVTKEYKLGAERALALFTLLRPTTLYLKAKSPMCAVTKSYDGTHEGKLIPRPGLFLSRLKKELADFECQLIEVD